MQTLWPWLEESPVADITMWPCSKGQTFETRMFETQMYTPFTCRKEGGGSVPCKGYARVMLF